MDVLERKALTESLAKLTAGVAADLRAQIMKHGPLQAQARGLHADERVGEPFEAWTDLLSRRAAALWVLKSLYVRVLEDRNLIPLKRIKELDSQELFAKLAPSLGETAYLRWVYRDLATPEGGLHELFAPQPAEIAGPSDALSRQILDFWRTTNPDTGKLIYSFGNDESNDELVGKELFDGRLMGDVYEHLDPVARARYGMIQTPGFVVNFILDQTLTPAIKQWGARTVRIIDPACGSGHFLLSAFRRLVDATWKEDPDSPFGEIVKDCMARVVGIDINDYACLLARARLVMTAIEMLNGKGPKLAAHLHPQVYWADALEQVERGQTEQGDLFTGYTDASRATLTRPETRAALRPVLQAGFHVVVANPPYITEKDKTNLAYHREKLGKQSRYRSAYRQYSLAAPFTERCFQLCVKGGYAGLIVANSFMKREFGKALIEQVLPHEDLFKVVDASGAYIPGHGTPTVLLFGRHQVPTRDDVLVVMGKRGEPGTPDDPAQGKVWTSITHGHAIEGFESEFVSVASVPRATLSKHPWSLGGGGAAGLKQTLDDSSKATLGQMVGAIGFVCMTRADDVYFTPTDALERSGVQARFIMVTVEGEKVRNWCITDPNTTVFPYDADLKPVAEREAPEVHRFLWPYRTILWLRREPNGDHRDLGLTWWEWSRFQRERFRTPLSIAFAFVSTHNQFALDRGGKVFKQSAPVIKLRAGTSEEEHLALLGLLNSSTACFWMKQVFQAKAGSGMGRGIQAEAWMDRYEHDATKLQAFPVVARRQAEVEALATRLDALGRKRVEDSARMVLDDVVSRMGPGGASALRAILTERRIRDEKCLLQMVGLQEELDWVCYRLYGLAPNAPVFQPNEVPRVMPGLRPFEIALAREDAERRAVLERGEEPDEAPTAWFERHGWEPHTSTEAIEDPDYRKRVEDRLERTAASPWLSLIEQPTYKRRWYRPDYEAEEREALSCWLSDRLEAWAKGRPDPWTVRQAAASLHDDPAVLAVGELLAGRRDFELEALLAERIKADAVPNNKHHVYKPSGLEKRTRWEETWDLQRIEDAGEKAMIPVPPKYGSGDFLKTESWQLRGKLDVPKERFIAFTEMPGIAAGPSDTLYGWAGWTPRHRARVLLELIERCEDQDLPLEDRIGLLYGVGFLLPYVARESEAAAREFRAVVEEQVGASGVTEAMLSRWAESHLPGSSRKSGGQKKVR